jgi:WD40 repeat protein
MALLASEDHNLYTFDVRHMNAPVQIYKGHVAAVMSCEWAPTGVEFVSGGWDRTVRIWNSREAGGKEKGPGGREVVYHTKRMQRVTSTIYSSDARYVLSGSDDGNVRIWKAKASDKLGVITARERAAMEYRETLVKRWAVDKDVGRVQRFVHSSFLSKIVSHCLSTGLVTYQKPSTKLANSSTPCSRHAVSRKNGEESILAPASRNQRRRRRKPSSRSSLDILWRFLYLLYASYLHTRIAVVSPGRLWRLFR